MRTYRPFTEHRQKKIYSSGTITLFRGRNVIPLSAQKAGADVCSSLGTFVKSVWLKTFSVPDPACRLVFLGQFIRMEGVTRSLQRLDVWSVFSLLSSSERVLFALLCTQH